MFHSAAGPGGSPRPELTRTPRFRPRVPCYPPQRSTAASKTSINRRNFEKAPGHHDGAVDRGALRDQGWTLDGPSYPPFSFPFRYSLTEFLLKIVLAWWIVGLRCQGAVRAASRAETTLGLGIRPRAMARRPGRRRRMGITSSIHVGPYEIFYPLKPSVSSVQQYGQHNLPGRLFVVEGIDGSGKSTQLSLLHKWLEARGYGVVFSEWNSSPLVKDTTRLGKKKKLLTPATFSLVHATDFADRTEHSILPFLKAGAIVLCDRYIYTAFARDSARGMDGDWVRDLYGFAVKPTAAFYFRVPLETAIGRLVGARDGFKYYEAGLDLGLTGDAEDSFRLFQGRILEEYEKMIPEFGLTVIDATMPVESQQAQVRQIVQSHLADARELRVKR